jgi:hypothetical protein
MSVRTLVEEFSALEDPRCGGKVEHRLIDILVITVVDYPDGRLAIRYRGVDLAYRTFDKLCQVSQAAIVENKQLGAALAFIREQQLRREPERRSGPRRRDQHDARLFKAG